MSSNSTNRHLDALDQRILAELQTDARLSTSELARRVGVSAPTVAERIRKLEAAQVILGYHVELNPAALGLPVSAWVRIRPATGQLPKVAQLARTIPQVTECHRTTGEDCFLLRVHAPTVAGLEEILDKFLLHGQTISSVIVSSPVPPRTVPVSGETGER